MTSPQDVRARLTRQAGQIRENRPTTEKWAGSAANASDPAPPDHTERSTMSIAAHPQSDATPPTPILFEVPGEAGHTTFSERRAIALSLLNHRQPSAELCRMVTAAMQGATLRELVQMEVTRK